MLGRSINNRQLLYREYLQNGLVHHWPMTELSDGSTSVIRSDVVGGNHFLDANKVPSELQGETPMACFDAHKRLLTKNTFSLPNTDYTFIGWGVGTVVTAPDSAFSFSIVLDPPGLIIAGFRIRFVHSGSVVTKAALTAYSNQGTGEVGNTWDVDADEVTGPFQIASVVRDGTGSLSINGKVVATLQYPTIPELPTKIAVGWPTALANYNSYGCVGAFSYYNRALTDDEVDMAYIAGPDFNLVEV